MAAKLDADLAVRALVEIKINVERPSPLGAGHVPEQFVYLRSSQPVRDPNGNVIGFSVALMDITNRERAEAALRESEENYRSTVDLNPHVPWTTDAAGTTLNNSPASLLFLASQPNKRPTRSGSIAFIPKTGKQHGGLGTTRW